MLITGCSNGTDIKKNLGYLVFRWIANNAIEVY